jgi:hypothetical protein
MEFPQKHIHRLSAGPTTGKSTTEHDPFLFVRDAGEDAADRVMREFLIRENPPALIFRQDALDGGYALVVPRLEGERLLTVPGLHESDFMFHGNPDTTLPKLAEFVEYVIRESGVDHLRLPLLTQIQAESLCSELSSRLPDWRLATMLASIVPVAIKVPRERKSLRKAIARAHQSGLVIQAATSFPKDEILGIHNRRWGRNRGDSFFKMLAALLDKGAAELISVRTADGILVAVQLDILGEARRHMYYSVSDTRRYPGAGTAALGFSMRRFMQCSDRRIYSFGRGSERYKYQYANAVNEVFELRGFFTPVPTAFY